MASDTGEERPVLHSTHSPTAFRAANGRTWIARKRIDLRRGEIRSVVWATGIKADFSWVEVPVFDPRGRLRHEGGVTPWPGLYVIGMPLLRRRRSTFIDGAAADSADLAAHLAAHLDSVASATAS